uniref:Uncharacterized protein n=1 Tax=viral metagenome TaxID=1070528 RepID=A0A6C0E1T4_9ZZZZ
MTETNIALSIYIPRVLKFHTVESIANTCFHAGIGIVHRVDFVAIENAEYYMSAFVHMKELNTRSYLVSGILSQFAEEKPYKFNVSPNEFWILLKAKNVVPDTRLNIHQLAENHRLLESTIASQEEQIARMKGDIERLQDTVYQLLGAAVDQGSPDAIYNWLKYGKNDEDDDDYADMPELISPSDEEDEEPYEIMTPKFIGRNLEMEFLDSP